MKNILLLALFLQVFGACQGQKEYTVVEKGMEELTFLKEEAIAPKNSTGKTFLSYSVHYYLIGSKIAPADIDSAVALFVRENMESLKGNAEQLDMIFYKRSNKTNKEHLSLHPKDIDRYSQNHDMLWVYTWWNSTNSLARLKFRNGQLIYPETEITIKDIP